MGWAVFQGTVTDAAGNVVPSAEITVKREIVGAPLAPLKPNVDGSGTLNNPFNAEANGYFRFYVEGGGFFKIEARSGGTLVAEPLRDVPIGTAAGSDAAAFGTAAAVAQAQADATDAQEKSDAFIHANAGGLC